MANIFTGILDLDNIPPAISDISPTPLSTGVLRTADISFNITDIGAGVDISSLDVTVSSVPAIVNGSFISGFSGTILSIVDGYAVTITPATAFAYDADIQVELYVQDLAGIFNFTSQTWSFHTELDTTPPTFENPSPVPGSMDISPSTSIAVDVIDSESGIDPLSISFTIEGVDVVIDGLAQPGYSYLASPIANGYTLTITPSSALPSSLEINCYVAATNLAGLTSDYSWSFTTFDNEAPVIEIISPTAGQIDVPADANILFRVIENIGLYSLNVRVAGDYAISNGVFQTGFSGTIEEVPGDGYTVYNVTVNPDSNFTSYQHVYVEVDAADIAENNSALAWEFIVVDTQAPVITNEIPSDGSVGVPVNTVAFVQVLDSESGVDAGSISMTVRGEPAITGGVYQSGYSGSIDAIPGGYQVHVHPVVNYNSYDVISISISASDNAGNSSSFSWSFRTEDLQFPQILNIQPVNGSVDVLVTSSISLDVRDAESGIDIASLNIQIDGSDAIIAGEIQTGFSGTITPTVDGYSVSITPDIPFSGNSLIQVSASVSDIAGNTSNVLWSFTTEILISYIMRAFRTISAEYVDWYSGSPDPLGLHAPYPAAELTDIVILNIINGGTFTYAMRAYHIAASEYIYWNSLGSPDSSASLAPVPAPELSDIAVSSIWQA